MKGRANRVMSASLEPAAFTYSIERGIELRLLKKAEYGALVAKGYKGIVANAKVNDQGLVDIYSACEGPCVQASYDAYGFQKLNSARLPETKRRVWLPMAAFQTLLGLGTGRKPTHYEEIRGAVDLFEPNPNPLGLAETTG